ncbi:MAG: hypothetical protein LBL30_03210 [Holosporales bacterium]|jgi:hypothetical protein|nr:hypothetical protein [Holosporales bacterium]
MSLRKLTAEEKKELKELQEKYPLKVERYLDIDTVLVLELPYLMLGIDMKGYNPAGGYGGIVEHSLIKEADEIIDSAVLANKLELQKREIVGFKADQIRYEYSPYLLPLKLSIKDDKPEDIKRTIEYASALSSLPHKVIYKIFNIIDVISWLDKEKAIDPRFPLSLPKKLVKHHKKKHEIVQYHNLEWLSSQKLDYVRFLNYLAGNKLEGIKSKSIKIKDIKDQSAWGKVVTALKEIGLSVNHKENSNILKFSFPNHKGETEKVEISFNLLESIITLLKGSQECWKRQSKAPKKVLNKP